MYILTYSFLLLFMCPYSCFVLLKMINNGESNQDLMIGNYGQGDIFTLSKNKLKSGKHYTNTLSIKKLVTQAKRITCVKLIDRK